MGGPVNLILTISEERASESSLSPNQSEVAGKNSDQDSLRKWMDKGERIEARWKCKVRSRELETTLVSCFRGRGQAFNELNTARLILRPPFFGAVQNANKHLPSFDLPCPLFSIA